MKPQQVGFLSAIWALALLLSLISPSVHAQVTGPCANCHTMHNSQGGNPMAREGTGVGWTGFPNWELGGGSSAENASTALLVSDCLGCHSSDTTETIVQIGGSRIPIVYNTLEPANPLAGGNFFWVKTDDAKGHNVFPGEGDDVLSAAPGASNTCGGNSCHFNFHAKYAGDSEEVGLNGRQGCTGCHMLDDLMQPKGFHHADDSDPVKDRFPWYRFLKGHQVYGSDDGVSGIEDSDWEAAKGPVNHNEYLGEYQSGGNTKDSWDLSLSRTMTAFCSGCHGNFHVQESSGTWIRHPSDAEIPNSGEYASAFGASGGVGGEYDPDIPVARSSDHSVWSSGIPSPTVDPAQGNDMVMCLSCHRAHGSPYPDMLRWDYDAENMEVGSGGTGGCFKCHTEKN
jgi:predicted CXXCH cytochrome family protein